MSEKIYPEWVQAQRTKGTTVKKVGNNYYLYKHSSKRVPGKKYPVPSDTYIGKITPDGVEKGTRIKVNTSQKETVIVREYGLSRAMELRCPQDWKDTDPERWKETLYQIIFNLSSETYLQDQIKKPKIPLEKNALNAKTASFSRRLYKMYGVRLEDIKKLSTIYLVTIGKKQMISKISEEQQQILGSLSLELEVD